MTAEVEVMDRLAVVEPGDPRVGRPDALARRAGRLAARQDAEQQDLGLGELFAKRLDDRGDAVGDLHRRVGVEVVGADHQDDDCGLDTLDCAVLEAPEKILGPIAADPEVRRVACAIVSLPDLDRPVSLVVVPEPALHDRIAEEEQVDVALRGALDERFVQLHPGSLAGRWSRRGLLRCRLGDGASGPDDHDHVKRPSGPRSSRWVPHVALPGPACVMRGDRPDGGSS
jgi:hypothetical protein